MSLLEAPCAKALWRVLLFRAIWGIAGTPIVCFDIRLFKKVNNSETASGGRHCDFEQLVPCLTLHACMNSAKFVLEAPGDSILWGATLPWQCADSLGGASIRDITVVLYGEQDRARSMYKPVLTEMNLIRISKYCQNQNTIQIFISLYHDIIANIPLQ